MDKMFIYGGITIGSLIGSYLPMIIFHVSVFGFASIMGGIIGCFVGLWLGYKAYQNFD